MNFFLSNSGNDCEKPLTAVSSLLQITGVSMIYVYGSYNKTIKDLFMYNIFLCYEYYLGYFVPQVSHFLATNFINSVTDSMAHNTRGFKNM